MRFAIRTRADLRRRRSTALITELRGASPVPRMSSSPRHRAQHPLGHTTSWTRVAAARRGATAHRYGPGLRDAAGERGLPSASGSSSSPARSPSLDYRPVLDEATSASTTRGLIRTLATLMAGSSPSSRTALDCPERLTAFVLRKPPSARAHDEPLVASGGLSTASIESARRTSPRRPRSLASD